MITTWPPEDVLFLPRFGVLRGYEVVSAVSVWQNDVFHAALQVLTFREHLLQKATCVRDVMISLSFAFYRKQATLAP